MSAAEAMEPLPSRHPTQPHRGRSTTRSWLLGIHPDELHKWWPQAAKHLQPALDHADDGTTLDEVRQQIVDGRSMLWVYAEDEHLMSAVLSIENNRLYAWLIGGAQIGLWLDTLLEAMRRYAQESGMDGLSAVTRPGIARMLRQRGWTTHAEIIRITI